VRRLDLARVRQGDLRDPVATIGVFDGVHRGHRQLLYELSVWARATGGESVVLTFDRHPLEVLRGEKVAPILSLENRLLEFERHGIDATVILDFAAIRHMGPREFLSEILVARLGCRRLLLGFDSRIGKDRSGDAARVREEGSALGIDVRVASPVLDKEGGKIGSSAIREAIRKGELDRAANLLGRPMTLRGHVVHGAGRGKGLGIPTANIDTGEQILPPDGVYLARVFRGADTAPAVMNLGVRPTFGGSGKRVLEVHVPGWHADLTGEALEVRPVRFLRAERKFESPAALKAQIEADLSALAQAVARGEI
jgi:riboflavin kinase / FMN adenylyltransferase